MTRKVHVSVSIDGILKNYSRKKINFLQDDNGKTLSDKQARKELADLKSKGYKFIPIDGCEGFDPFGKGCPGHEVKE